MEWKVGYRQQAASYPNSKLDNPLKAPNIPTMENQMERWTMNWKRAVGTQVYESYLHSALKSINITYIGLLGDSG